MRAVEGGHIHGLQVFGPRRTPAFAIVPKRRKGVVRHLDLRMNGKLLIPLKLRTESTCLAFPWQAHYYKVAYSLHSKIFQSFRRPTRSGLCNPLVCLV